MWLFKFITLVDACRFVEIFHFSAFSCFGIIYIFFIILGIYHLVIWCAYVVILEFQWCICNITVGLMSIPTCIGNYRFFPSIMQIGWVVRKCRLNNEGSLCMMLVSYMLIEEDFCLNLHELNCLPSICWLAIDSGCLSEFCYWKLW